MDPKQRKRKPNPAAKGHPAPVTRANAGKKRPARRPAPEKAEEPRFDTDVVYLPPKPFSRNRLILHLATVAAVVFAFVLCLSLFFKVEIIEISGADRYTAWDIEQASGIEQGDNLLTFGRTKAAGKIISALPYVKEARVGIKLPNTVKIEVVEVEITYSVEGIDGQWWLISSDGKVVDKVSDGNKTPYAKVEGVKLENVQIGHTAKAWQDPQPPTDAQGNQVPVTITAAQRLQAVVDLAGFLEANGIIGKIESIDVTYLTDIQMWYGDRFQIVLGGTDQMSLKIANMKAALEQVFYDEGILDLRDPNEIIFREFP